MSSSSSSEDNNNRKGRRSSYQLGEGKNKPIGGGGNGNQLGKNETTESGSGGAAVDATTASTSSTSTSIDDDDDSSSESSSSSSSAASNWNFMPIPEDIIPKSEMKTNKVVTSEGSFTMKRYDVGLGKNLPVSSGDVSSRGSGTSRLVTKDEKSAFLSRAVDEEHYNREEENRNSGEGAAAMDEEDEGEQEEEVDQVWITMREEARREAEREPLLVSFLFSSILNHDSLESALAFHLANKMASPAMISTQVMSLFLEALRNSPGFRKSLREDILAVRERDPACTVLPDVFLYFKGFHAIQTHRVAHYLWQSGRKVLAHYLQSQMSQVFQIDIHPNATLGSGLMLDHGTGIVIGETAVVGQNCSILHHVTLGGSGRKGVDRHPKIGDGVLIGAGASILGNIRIGNGCQVGAGTLVIDDLPDYTVAVGVPAKIIGSFVDGDKAQPSKDMNQVGTEESDRSIRRYAMDGI